MSASAGTFFNRDRAYDLSVDPVFEVPHSASSVTVTWSLSATTGSAAANWQGGADESWAIENVSIAVPVLEDTSASPDLPSSLDAFLITPSTLFTESPLDSPGFASVGALPNGASLTAYHIEAGGTQYFAADVPVTLGGVSYRGVLAGRGR